jgi:lipopolysaccharide/colanic/teichoic acid biosynthesis glycosyltransferase
MRRDSDEILKKVLETDPQARQEWEQDHKLKNDPRVTRLGKFLRKSSLDEIPQLWNVLMGEMSLVGPRPIVNDEVAKYGKIYRLYSQVPPGITGLWQISGRNNTTYEERVLLDDFYVRNWSPWLDVYVLARTVYTILRRDGAY